MQNVDVLVRGAGAVGQCLALALARDGLRVALCDETTAAKPGDDVRAYALNAASAELLRALKVWQALPASAVTAVHEMRVHGDAPGASLEFSAWQQHVDALAWIVDAQALHEQLEAALRFSPQVLRMAHGVQCTAHGTRRASPVDRAVRRQEFGHARCFRRLRGAQRFWAEGHRGTLDGVARPSERRAPMVPQPRRAGLVAARRAASINELRAGLVVPDSARRRVAALGRARIRTRTDAGQRRCGGRAATVLAAHGMAPGADERSALVRARLGAARRRRARGAPAGRAGLESGPGGRGGAEPACSRSANPGANWATSACCAAMRATAPRQPGRCASSPAACCNCFHTPRRRCGNFATAV